MNAALLPAAQWPTVAAAAAAAPRSNPHRLIYLFRTCHSPSPTAGKFHGEPFSRYTEAIPIPVPQEGAVISTFVQVSTVTADALEG